MANLVIIPHFPMKTLLVLMLGLAAQAASAQTPATNLMPDGSRDMYLGLGVQSAPRYEGADGYRTRALPVLQVQWSNGAFVSGSAAGMHLSQQPNLEYGPLLAYLPGRDASGVGQVPGDLGPAGLPGLIGPGGDKQTGNRLLGMTDRAARIGYGGFVNVYLQRELRWTTSALYGAGETRRGLRIDSDLQWSLLGETGSRHSLALQTGISYGNQALQQSVFGVSAADAARSGNRVFNAKAGLSDVHLGLRWNWKLTPSWMLVSSLRASHLQGSAADSPLVEQRSQLSVSSALAYRF